LPETILSQKIDVMPVKRFSQFQKKIVSFSVGLEKQIEKSKELKGVIFVYFQRNQWQLAYNTQ
jgi:hypothetical protein